jgi:hypothetical protein
MAVLRLVRQNIDEPVDNVANELDESRPFTQPPPSLERSRADPPPARHFKLRQMAQVAGVILKRLAIPVLSLVGHLRW